MKNPPCSVITTCLLNRNTRVNDLEQRASKRHLWMIEFLFKRPWDYNFTHFRYQNFGIVPEWFIVKFQAKNDYWAHPWSFKKSVLLVSSHPKASHPQIWKIFRKRKSQFLSSYYSSITVIFHVAYTYKSSKFFAKRPGWFVIKKSLVWRLRDFSSVANLPGSPVPELKSDLKIQIFISNLEDWGVKLHWSYNKNPPKNCVTFLGFEPCFQPSLFFASMDSSKLSSANCIAKNQLWYIQDAQQPAFWTVAPSGAT